MGDPDKKINVNSKDAYCQKYKPATPTTFILGHHTTSNVHVLSDNVRLAAIMRGEFHSKVVQKAVDLHRVTQHAIKTYTWSLVEATLAPTVHELRRHVRFVQIFQAICLKKKSRVTLDLRRP